MERSVASSGEGARPRADRRAWVLLSVALLGSSCVLDFPPAPALPPLSVGEVAPDAGFAGDTVVLMGRGFAPEALGNEVHFGETMARQVVVPPGGEGWLLRVTVPPGAGDGPISVRAGSRAGMSSQAFRYLGAGQLQEQRVVDTIELGREPVSVACDAQGDPWVLDRRYGMMVRGGGHAGEPSTPGSLRPVPDYGFTLRHAADVDPDPGGGGGGQLFWVVGLDGRAWLVDASHPEHSAVPVPVEGFVRDVVVSPGGHGSALLLPDTADITVSLWPAYDVAALYARWREAPSAGALEPLEPPATLFGDEASGDEEETAGSLAAAVGLGEGRFLVQTLWETDREDNRSRLRLLSVQQGGALVFGDPLPLEEPSDAAPVAAEEPAGAAALAVSSAGLAAYLRHDGQVGLLSLDGEELRRGQPEGPAVIDTRGCGAILQLAFSPAPPEGDGAPLLFVLGAHDPRLFVYDTASGELVAAPYLGPDPTGGLRACGGLLHAALPGEGTVARIEPASALVWGQLPLASPPKVWDIHTRLDGRGSYLLAGGRLVHVDHHTLELWVGPATGGERLLADPTAPAVDSLSPGAAGVAIEPGDPDPPGAPLWVANQRNDEEDGWGTLGSARCAGSCVTIDDGWVTAAASWVQGQRSYVLVGEVDEQQSLLAFDPAWDLVDELPLPDKDLTDGEDLLVEYHALKGLSDGTLVLRRQDDDETYDEVSSLLLVRDDGATLASAGCLPLGSALLAAVAEDRQDRVVAVTRDPGTTTRLFFVQPEPLALLDCHDLGHGLQFERVVLSPDGRRLYAASRSPFQGVIVVELGEPQPAEAPAASPASSPGAGCVAAADAMERCRADEDTSRIIGMIPLPAPPTALAVSTTGDQLLVATDDDYRLYVIR